MAAAGGSDGDAPDGNMEIVGTAAAPAVPSDYALRGLWYYALPSRALETGRLVARTIMGEALVFGRDAEGTPFVLDDVCPHRGIPLHFGSFDGNEVQCCYHGWRFAPDGRLTHVPSLVEGQPFDYDRVRVHGYPVREADGNIWIFMGEGRGPHAPDSDIPRLPDLGGANFHRIFETQLFPCPLDHAVMGLMDPAHGPFVHASWWWRPSTSAHAKEKRFAPSRARLHHGAPPAVVQLAPLPTHGRRARDRDQPSACRACASSTSAPGATRW